MSDREGFDEVTQKIVDGATVEQRLRGLTPEQVLAGLAPEQVLALFNAEQVLLALPDEALRGFTDAYLATLLAPTRATIRARIGR